jgi:hypothetical protein
MTSSRTPLRHARAGALHCHLVGRQERVETYVNQLPAERQEQARAAIADVSNLAGVYAAIFLLGGSVGETGANPETYRSYAEEFVDRDALNVAAVTRHLTGEADWKVRDVETALNDLADDEAIRLVAEYDTGHVAIVPLRRADEAAE